MNLESTPQRCLRLVDELDYDAGGNPAVLELLEKLRAELAAMDFDGAEAMEELAAYRARRLAGEAMVAVELPTGARVEFVRGGYHGETLTIFTLAGVIDLPFALLPADLQECFPKSAPVVHRQALETIRANIRNLHEAIEASEETGSGQLAAITETIAGLAVEMEELVAENEELRRQLRERHGDRW